jgi:hypothetical protein
MIVTSMSYRSLITSKKRPRVMSPSRITILNQVVKPSGRKGAMVSWQTVKVPTGSRGQET